MRDAALALARLRASRTGSSPVPGIARAAAAVSAGGRRLVPVDGAANGSEVTLGWDEAVEPDPDAQGFEVQRLAPSALATLGVCIACCWPDPDRDPLPGLAVEVDDVLAVAAGAGIDLRWAKAALRHDLHGAGFVTLDESAGTATVRLGPALAAWPDGQWSLLRRSHDRLPTLPASSRVEP